MGDLIFLTRIERPSRQPTTSDRSAEILFFTGVRYYRMADETPAPLAKPRRRRRVAGLGVDVPSRVDRQA